MILNKALLLKCLGGVAACLGTASIAVVGSGSLGSNNVSSESESELKELIEKVGLSECTSTDSGSNECTISNLKVKYESGSGEENKTKQNSDSETSGKIKVYSDNTYSNKFKFVIEEGDISLTGGTGSSISKLEQFETYEIKEEGDKWYLTRKKKAGENIKDSLGLPEGCTLVETITCSSVSLDGTKLKAINFEGKSDSSQASLTSGASITLSISKETTDTDVYTGGYKFSFTTGSTGDVTIPGTSESITLKSNTTTEFKIKKENQNLFLEKIWDISKLSEKVGLECNTDSSCTQKSGQKTNIKHDTVTHDSKTLTITDPTKIKVHKGTSGYNEGFKFVIEGGDVTFDGSQKLEENDTYEIKKENNKWYLSRKTESDEKKLSKALGLPDGCKLPKTDNTSTNCENINADKLKAIKFDGKNESGTWTIGNSETITLKITKTSDITTFPKGYRFAFEGDKEISIPLTSNGPITLKKNTNTEFKVKNGGGESNLTLEKAWTPQELLKKVQVTGTCTTDPKQCPLEGKINVFNENNAYVTGASFGNGGESKKITYEEDQEGYNQGIKFTVTEEITLNDGNKTGSIEKIEKKDNSGSPSYEIKEQTVGDSTSWYLSKKNNSQ